MSKNKAQHVAPAFYLRNFQNGGGFLEVYDVRAKTFRPPTTAQNVAHEKHAFSIQLDDEADKTFDQINNNVETQCGPTFKDLRLSNSTDSMVQKCATLLCANLVTRSRTLRDGLSLGLQKGAQFMAKMPVVNLDDKISRLFGFEGWDPKEASKTLLVGSKLVAALSLPLLTDVHEILAKKNLRFITPTDSEFFTSDEPVLILSDSETEAKTVTAVINDNGSRMRLALTPQLLAEWSDDLDTSPLIWTREQTIEHNRQVLERAYYQCFSTNKILLEEIVGSTKN